MEGHYFGASDLLNYSYCPRIIYFSHVLKKPQITTKKEYKGREKETEFRQKAARTKVVKKYPPLPKIFKVRLASDRLGIKTICDSIMLNKEKGEAYPIQAKYAYKPRAIYRTMKMQINMEALLIEEVMKLRSPYGFIKFLKTGDLVKVNADKKEEVVRLFSDIRQMIFAETMPNKTKYPKRCVDCCFKNIC